MSEINYRSVFCRDEGALLEIMVFDATPENWNRILKHLSQTYLAIYTEDGNQMPLPDVQEIWNAQQRRSVMLEIVLPGFTINCHFVEPDQIRFNVLPEDVDSQAKANAVFRLMTEMRDLLYKEVLLAPEYGNATHDELRQIAICTADPSTRSIRCRGIR